MIGSKAGWLLWERKGGTLPPKSRLEMSVIIITNGLGMNLMIQETRHGVWIDVYIP
jgi:hypothetical protein